jgi:glycosyltransferase involved in cell wall biosynthesis
MTGSRPEVVRVLRVIARMNIGGPAHHVSLLCGRLDPDRYETLLVRGRLGPGEGSFEGLAEREGCRVQVVEELGPDIRPLADARALAELVRIVRGFRPHIVHTHTAKAGFVGRLAALVGQRPRPLILHTYHGHVLEGYFGPARTLLFRTLERGMARGSDRLIGVSRATVDDLVRLRVAPRKRFAVIPIGLDLDGFLAATRETGARFRAEVGAGTDEVLLACVGRLVPIKRVDVLIRAVALARREGAPLRLAIVGDGESRAELEALAGSLGLAEHVVFCGYLPDVTTVAAAADVAVLSSDNEGTPVSLIEAAAAARPAVATAVGGVPDVVEHGVTGILVPPGDQRSMADALAQVAGDSPLRERMGAAAREHVRERFSSERLIDDVERLYTQLALAGPGS